jgi:predicted nuclease of predicted toxin-antitoxin system
VLLTHDQDMGTLLALGKGRRPSVILLRTGDLRPQAVGPRLLAVLKSLEEDLRAGALVVVEDRRVRVRRLPLG